MKYYEAQHMEYDISIPKNTAEVKSVGEKLNICVNSYVPSIAAGRTAVLFVHKKDSENVYMVLEIKHN